MNTTVNMQRGVFRRIYACAAHCPDLNGLSDFAERLYWRLHVIADDFGNFLTDHRVLCGAAIPLLRRSQKTVAATLRELVDSGLIVLYEADGRSLAHIVDFLACQPTPRNGRRIRRVPAWPGEQAEQQKHDGADGQASARIGATLGETGGPQNESETESEEQSENQSESENESENHAQVRPGAPPAHRPAPVPASTGGRSGGSPQCAPIDSSLSDSRSPSHARLPRVPGGGLMEQRDPATARLVAEQKWLLRVEPLWSPAEPQRKSDRTDSENLFDETIWPEDVDDGEARVRQAYHAVDKAMRNGKCKMAYLRSELERMFGKDGA